MKKVLFVLTSQDKKGSTGLPTGYYVPEAAHPWKVLIEQGWEVEFTSPQGGQPPADGVEDADVVSQEFLAAPDIKRKLSATARPETLSAGHYAAILFVGGHGTMWDFPANQPLARLAADIYGDGGIVAAVCHGPAALVNLRLKDGSYLVAGRRVAAFTDDEERAVGLDKVVPFLLASTLQARGAIHVPAANWQSNVVIDGRLVTGQNPASASGVGQAMAQLLAELPR